MALNARRVTLGAGGPEVAPTTFFSGRFGGVSVGFSAEGDSELIDRLGDGGFRRLLRARDTVVADFDHHAGIVRYWPKDVAADRFLRLLETDLPRVVVDAVDDDFHPI